VFVSGLLAAGCTIGLYTVAAAKKVGPEVLALKMGNAPDSNATTTGVSARAVYSHRKLLQTGVSKTGAPVYRFVECRHLPKTEAKLVQVGISKDGLAVFRLKRGDYCVFAANSIKPSTMTQLNDSSFKDSPAENYFANDVSTLPVTAPPKTSLTANQQYVCEKFGPACRVALAIQRAENSIGACEIYHYNTSDGTLDWGYFHINSVHLRRPGLNLRDLLDCKANIDYAYQLFLEKGFAPWTSYTSGAYRKFLRLQQTDPRLARLVRALTALGPMPRLE
jgi:hypothetical protein